MKISIDASDSLDDALRLVGALYGVTLRVEEEAAVPTQVTAVSSRRRTAAASGGSRRRAAASRRSGGRRRSTTANDVRQWARDNGVAVNDRGRLPASVLAAYRDSAGH